MIEKLLIVSAIIIFGFSSAFAEPHKSRYIADLKTTHSVSDYAGTANLMISYTVSFQSSKYLALTTAYPLVDIKSALEEIVSYYSLYLLSDGLRGSDCQSGFNLNIFIIGSKEMSSSSRFADYFKSIGWEGGRVYAFYDATPEIRGNSSILLTDLSPRLNYLSLAHEIAHYMWDRQCLASHYGSDSESFSKRFESYIDKNTD
jgi:hypothetical protein